jgi:hypothetical protein
MAKLEACKEKVREEHVDEEELGESMGCVELLSCLGGLSSIV